MTAGVEWCFEPTDGPKNMQDMRIVRTLPPVGTGGEVHTHSLQLTIALMRENGPGPQAGESGLGWPPPTAALRDPDERIVHPGVTTVNASPLVRSDNARTPTPTPSRPIHVQHAPRPHKDDRWSCRTQGMASIGDGIDDVPLRTVGMQ